MKRLFIAMLLGAAVTLGAPVVFAQQQGGQSGSRMFQGGQTQSGQQAQAGQTQQQSGPAVPVYISPSDVRQIQQKLSQSGVYKGQVDGVWGDETANAVRDYQRQNKLDPTGRLDLDTLGHLGIFQHYSQQGQQSHQQSSSSAEGQQGQQGEQSQQPSSSSTETTSSQGSSQEGGTPSEPNR